eukprot:CAMPEP_0179486266 /NCGR_PEP_ID=MMETSP0799-20121207/62629_1 /TAXON_ID=46947 /ORGANISM="Geminigera cryophila, Strain CCMP2564" /LENGTH=59 /DNA_ID=CAMNT_0021300971 /DNA_START=394 /DNA_END=573 /DNA_ORIENTATION=+
MAPPLPLNLATPSSICSHVMSPVPSSAPMSNQSTAALLVGCPEASHGAPLTSAPARVTI